MEYMDGVPAGAGRQFGQYIEEVKELDEILHQEVPYGTKYKDLEPDKMKVRVWAEEASDEEEDAEDKDGTVRKSPSEADATEKLRNRGVDDTEQSIPIRCGRDENR